MIIRHTSLVFFESIGWLIKEIYKIIRRKVNETRRAL